MPTGDLRTLLSIEGDVPEFEAQAVTGVGVFETLKAIVKGCLALIGDPAELQEGRSPSVLPGRRASMFPGGAPPAASREPSPGTMPPPPSLPVPRPSRVPSFSIVGEPETVAREVEGGSSERE
jgi:hypothetical protein